MLYILHHHKIQSTKKFRLKAAINKAEKYKNKLLRKKNIHKKCDDTLSTNNITIFNVFLKDITAAFTSTTLLLILLLLLLSL